jgi:hypothetical protein
LITSTLLTLIVVPTLYGIFEGKESAGPAESFEEEDGARVAG